MKTVRIAQAQVNVTVGDLRGNSEKIAEWSRKAIDAGANIVTFPELCLCGYPPEDLLFKPRFLDDNKAAMEELAPRLKGIIAVVGFADRVGRDIFNAAALVADGVIRGVYHKVELPNYGVFDEKRYFAEGDRCLVFEAAGIRFSVTICEDIWIPESMTEKCVTENRAGYVLNISGSPFHAEKLEVRRNIVRRFAEASGATVFFNNLVGGQDELVFDGGSLVMGPDGEVIARSRRFEEDLLLYDVQGTDAASSEPGWRLIEERETPLKLESIDRDRAPAPPTIAPEEGRIEEVFHALVLGTRDYVRKNGFSEVVIGLSGGIDSALTAAVAVEALGAQNVMGVSMPSQFTSTETRTDAERLADNLGIKLITVPIHDMYQSYFSSLEGPLGGRNLGVTGENLQARIRGNILMALTNRYGKLVLTTGNKSEMAVGYCTLYGDTAGAFAVIKDVPKTLVYELAEYVNREADREIIPESVILRPPTAELAPDQKDEDSLPPYEQLDPILKAYVEEDKDPSEIYSHEFPPAVVDDVVKMVHRNEYKRRQTAPGVKITPKAFGKDRRLPITNRYVKGF